MTFGLVAAQSVQEPAALRKTQVYQGHLGKVEGLTYSPDNTQVFVLSGDTGYILDAITYKVVRSFPVVAPVSKNPRWLLEGTLQLNGWGHVVTLDMQTGKVLDDQQYLPGSISDVFLADNGLAALQGEHEINLFDASSGARTRTVYTGEDYLLQMAFNRAGDRLAFSSMSRGVVLNNSDTGDSVRLLAAQNELPQGFAFNADGTQIALSKGYISQPNLNVYDSTDGSLMYRFTGVRETYSMLQFSPQGHWLAAVNEGDINLFSAPESRLKYRLESPEIAGLKLAFSGDDGMLAYGTWFGDLHFASTQSGRVVKELKGLPGGSEWCAVLSPDGARVLTCGFDRTARIYDALTGTLILTLSGFPAWVNSGAFLPLGGGIVTTSGDSVISWSSSGKQLKSWSTREHNPDHLTTHPGGKLVAYTASNYDTLEDAVLVLNVETGAVAARFNSGSRRFGRLTFSPDGKTLAGIDDEGRVTLWDWNRQKERFSAKVGSQYSDVLSFDPKGILLAVASPQGGIQLLDVSILKKGRFLRLAGASEAHFNLSGDKLITYSSLGKVNFVVFNPRTGATLGSYGTQVGGDFMLTPDGKSLLLKGGVRGSTVNATLLSSPNGLPIFQ